jgi:hypothetical protein
MLWESNPNHSWSYSIKGRDDRTFPSVPLDGRTPAELLELFLLRVRLEEETRVSTELLESFLIIESPSIRSR